MHEFNHILKWSGDHQPLVIVIVLCVAWWCWKIVDTFRKSPYTLKDAWKYKSEWMHLLVTAGAIAEFVNRYFNGGCK